MFTGIVQTIGRIVALKDKLGLRTICVEFPPAFGEGLHIGASVAVDGVCLTVVEIPSATTAIFDIILQSLNVTTLGSYSEGAQVNLERAAKEGAEIGGHPLSGHIDFTATIIALRVSTHNHILRLAVPVQFSPYLFARGYVAIHGASLTLAEVNKIENWMEVCLIPETLRATVFAQKVVGDSLNIEIERQTQVIVDTVKNLLAETLDNILEQKLDEILNKKMATLQVAAE